MPWHTTTKQSRCGDKVPYDPDTDVKANKKAKIPVSKVFPSESLQIGVSHYLVHEGTSSASCESLFSPNSKNSRLIKFCSPGYLANDDTVSHQQ